MYILVLQWSCVCYFSCPKLLYEIKKNSSAINYEDSYSAICGIQLDLVGTLRVQNLQKFSK